MTRVERLSMKLVSDAESIYYLACYSWSECDGSSRCQGQKLLDIGGSGRRDLEGCLDQAQGLAPVVLLAQPRHLATPGDQKFLKLGWRKMARPN